MSKDALGNIPTETAKIQDTWTEYIKDLYNYPISTNGVILTTLAQGGPGPEEEKEPETIRSELEEAVKELKNGLAAGFDNIPS